MKKFLSLLLILVLLLGALPCAALAEPPEDEEEPQGELRLVEAAGEPEDPEGDVRMDQLIPEVRLNIPNPCADCRIYSFKPSVHPAASYTLRKIGDSVEWNLIWDYLGGSSSSWDWQRYLIEGDRFRVSIALSPNSGYKFSKTYTKAWLNGTSCDFTINEDGDMILSRDFTVQAALPFTDVAETKYYFFPVVWAYYYEPRVTNGTTDTTFSPNGVCTREQIVTFLWHAMGSPQPTGTSNPFVDVKAGKYYTNAVLWAYEKDITGGVDATHFGVGQPCTRAQAMTFLWKTSGSPAPSVGSTPFVDVKSGKFYTDAVLWAYGTGITNGMDDTHFGVNDTCTRGQIVTFLFKAVLPHYINTISPG